MDNTILKYLSVENFASFADKIEEGVKILVSMESKSF